MRHEDTDREITPDPVLGAALRWVDGDAPLQEVEWDSLRRNIRDRAAFNLAQRRTSRRARGRWIRPLVPLAAAASVAMAVWLGGGGGAGTNTTAELAGSGQARHASEEVLFTELSEQEFRMVVSGRSNPNELLMIAAEN